MDAIRRLLDRAHIEPSITRVAFGFDPLGAQALHGFAARPLVRAGRRLRPPPSRASPTPASASARPRRRARRPCGRRTEAQELGFALAAGLAYLRALEAPGLPLETARALLAFRLAADAEEFVAIAKFRALRRLWARVEEACGLAPAPIYVHAETAWRMATRRDPWTNLLRATLATFGAAIGGADAITVLPFTQALGAPDDFARRLARDTQLVLQDESHVHVVDDPAAGAGGMEALTEALCRAGLERVPEDRGRGRSRRRRWRRARFQGRVAETAGKRAQNVAARATRSPAPMSFPTSARRRSACSPPFDGRESRGPGAGGRGPLAAAAAASSRRAVRRRCATAPTPRSAATGARPRVFLANLGSVAAFTARANFAKNFFEAGGIEAVFGDDGGDIVAGFRASGAKLACVCSSDAIYAERAEAAARELAAAGARVYLAGRPGELEKALRAAGVADFVYAGGDMFDDAAARVRGGRLMRGIVVSVVSSMLLAGGALAAPRQSAETAPDAGRFDGALDDRGAAHGRLIAPLWCRRRSRFAVTSWSEPAWRRPRRGGTAHWGYVDTDGTIMTRFTAQGHVARAHGQLRGNSGQGAWSSSTDMCGGTWRAQRGGAAARGELTAVLLRSSRRARSAAPVRAQRERDVGRRCVRSRKIGRVPLPEGEGGRGAAG